MAEGSNLALGGTVRLTASEIISHHVLPPMLAAIRQSFPAVAIELVPSDSAENLLLREADIAVRMFRPSQLELVTRKLGVLPIICCAHRDYLARPRHAQTPADLRGHDSSASIGPTRSLPEPAPWGSSSAATTSSSERIARTAAWELIKAGLGIGFAQERLVADAHGMVAILPELTGPSLEVWLTTHRELFTSRRIRAIYDALAVALLAYLGDRQPSQ